jgi:hypothetical protein
MLRKSWLVLLAVLASCGPTGPAIRYCVLDKKEPIQNTMGQCSDHQGKESVEPVAKMDNWPCLSPRDRKSLLEACKLNREKDAGLSPTVTVCVLDCKVPSRRCMAQCSDGDFGVEWPVSKMDNYSCLSPQDNRTLLRYCKLGSAFYESLDNHALPQ